MKSSLIYACCILFASTVYARPQQQQELEAVEVFVDIVGDVDGRPTLDSIARVVWCKPRDNGRFWIGLALVADGRRQMLGVRHTRKSRRIGRHMGHQRPDERVLHQLPCAGALLTALEPPQPMRS